MKVEAMDDSSKPSFLATGHCILCCEPFHDDFMWKWKSKFALVCLSQSFDRSWPTTDAPPTVICMARNNKGMEIIEITVPGHLPEGSLPLDINLQGHQPAQVIRIYRKTREKHRPAFCCHDWCHSIIARLGNGPPKSILYRLGRSLAFFQPDPEDKLQTVVSHSDRCVARLPSLPLWPKLPPEIKSQIWGYVGLTMHCDTAILTAGEVPRLARYLRRSLDRDISLRQGSRLSVKMITVFGSTYIRDLAISEDCGVDHDVLRENVTTVKYIADHNGICAVKPLGENWESDWIGEIPRPERRWYGMIERGDPDTSEEPMPLALDIRCSYNDLLCTGISSLRRPQDTRILWDQPDHPSSSPDLYGYLPVRQLFFGYLPLYSKGQYTNGLTIYLGCKTVGLEAHFPEHSPRLSGSRYGFAQHFPLGDQERIAHVWLGHIDTPLPPFGFGIIELLTIQTTFGRVHSFGHHFNPMKVFRNIKNQWELLKSEGYISGFYYPKPKLGREIGRLNVISDGTAGTIAPVAPRYYDCHYPSKDMQKSEHVLTVATFCGLDKVDACYVGEWCTGLLIRYVDGPPEVLGQWDTRDFARRSCIYKRGDGPSIMKVCFRMMKFPLHVKVAAVEFLTDASYAPLVAEDKVFGINEYIAWWVVDYRDIVLRWKGKVRDVPQIVG